MSEKQHHHSPEQHSPRHEHEPQHEQAEKLKQLHKKAEQAEHAPKDNIEAIKKSIESVAVSGKEYSHSEKETPQPVSHGINKSLKATAYRRVIKKTQTHLSRPERIFSRAVHNPTVEKVSDVAAKTVARPSGILFGATGAFIGTVFVFYISKQAGFSYNYLLFFMLFIGGYVVGVLLELIIKSVQKTIKR